tara:strand:+ start:83 stop:550 length:468 start_codon:yes stop_codon:yes gene_type:complete
MVTSINSGMSMPPPPPRTEQSLTEDQQDFISETLSQFDADNITQETAASIVEAFAQAGIQPSAALEKSLTEFGFDAKSIGDSAKVSGDGNRPPPPPKQSAEEITSMVDYLAELMEETLAASNSNELSDEDKQSILAKVFEKFDIEDGESIINTTA